MRGDKVSTDSGSSPEHGLAWSEGHGVEGVTLRSRPCRLVDNSGDHLPEAELRDILNRLIEQDAFGFKPLSAAGGDTLELDVPVVAHIQIGGHLYRLIVHRYQARIEKF